MPTLTIKKLPAKIHARLKKSAATHRRSINQEAIECLEKSLASVPLNPQAFLARVRAFRERNQRIFVTEKDLRKAKNWGRL